MNPPTDECPECLAKPVIFQEHYFEDRDGFNDRWLQCPHCDARFDLPELVETPCRKRPAATA